MGIQDGRHRMKMWVRFKEYMESHLVPFLFGFMVGGFVGVALGTLVWFLVQGE